MKAKEKKGKEGDDIIPKRFLGGIAGQTYRYIRFIDGNNIVQTAAGDLHGAVYFALTSLDNYTEFTGLFDQYRIVAVELHIRPLQNNSQYFSTSTDLFPRFCSVIDYDDATVLTSAADYRQYQTYKETNWNQYHSRVIRPHLAVAAYSGAFNSYANMSGTWIDLVSPSVQHYGWKYFVSTGAVGQTHLQSWSVEYKYCLEFRQVR